MVPFPAKKMKLELNYSEVALKLVLNPCKNLMSLKWIERWLPRFVPYSSSICYIKQYHLCIYVKS